MLSGLQHHLQRSEQPFALVVHDLSSWKPEVIAKVKLWLQGGMHLIVCGAPPATDANRDTFDFLPALAKADPAGAARRFDRRPRLIFITDESRLGRLPFAPTGAALVEQTQQFSAIGCDVQERLIKATLEKLELKIRLGALEFPGRTISSRRV